MRQHACIRVLFFSVLGLMLAVSSVIAAAQERVMVPFGKAVSIQASSPSKVMVVRDGVVDILNVSDDEVMLTAKGTASGTTEVIVWDASGRRSFMVETYDELSVVGGKFHNIVSEPQVTFQVFPDTVYLRGIVSQEEKRGLAERTLASLLPDRKVVNLIEVKQAVGLEQRITAALNMPTVRVTVVNPNRDAIVTTTGAPAQVTASATADDRVILEGTVKDQNEYFRMVEVVSGFVAEEKISNLVSISDPLQVVFQAYILEMNRKTSEELGIRWGGATDIGGTFQQGIVNFFENTSNAWRGDTQAIGAPVPKHVNPLKMSNLNRFEIIDARIHALEKSGKTKVLANPKLVVYANAKPNKLAHTGWLGEGDNKPGKQGQVGQDPANDSGIAFFNTGTVQEVEVGRDTNGVPLRRQLEANLRLAIRDLFVMGDDLKFSVFARQADFVETANPAVNSRQVMTTVKVKNGESVVLGGLISKKDAISKEGVPLLSKLPGVGRLFRWQNKTNETTELVILLTPEILGRELDPMRGKKFETVPVPQRSDRLEKLHQLFQDIRDRHGQEGGTR